MNCCSNNRGKGMSSALGIVTGGTFQALYNCHCNLMHLLLASCESHSLLKYCSHNYVEVVCE